MSQFIATIEKIERSESLHIVTFLSCGQRLSMVSLELGALVLPGKEVKLSCKATSVALAKPMLLEERMQDVLSYANQIKATVLSIEKGELLSSVRVGFGDAVLEALILASSLEKMKLQEGDAVVALLKASDLSILEVLDV